MNTELSDYQFFVILGETKIEWQPPNTPERQKVLVDHYEWGLRLRQKNILFLAGPMNIENIGPDFPPPIGELTGLIVIHAGSKCEAENIAYQDPLHVSGFRKNMVYSWSIRRMHPDFKTSMNNHE